MISIISLYGKYLCVKKIRMLSPLKLSLPLNQQYIKIDLKNLQESNWYEVTKELKLDMYKFRTDSKEDDVNKCIEVLPVILYFAGCCCYNKIKCNNCKNWRRFVE